MRVLPIVLAILPTFAYQVTYPGGFQGWNTTGPNVLIWDRVDTDPLNFTAVLTNMGNTNDQILNAIVDGTLGHVVCNPPSGGWPSGSGYRVNLAQDAQHLDSLLAQSSVFNITAIPSSTSSTSAQSSSSASTTVSSSGVSSSDTSTTPTGTSAASIYADTRAGLLAAVAASAVLITMFI